MKRDYFAHKIKALGIQTLAGVPDSTLKSFCDYIYAEGSKEFTHYVGVNEGAAVGIGIGTYLATGKPACIYMQNSGLGNVVNPITSLANEEVYGIPMLLLVGYRGEPGKKDEPQHKFMGQVTESILGVLAIPHAVIGGETTSAQLDEVFESAKEALLANKQYAIVIKKDTFDCSEELSFENSFTLVREEAIGTILKSLTPEDVVISTTGKISREVYEQSDLIFNQHHQDFLTVGGMGFASSIAFGYGVNRPDKKVYCMDGDGAVLMHMGNLAFVGTQSPSNLIHICLNNQAHESVGGMPTGATGIEYGPIAKSCGYKKVYRITSKEQLESEMALISKEEGPIFVEVMISMEVRSDLGRPKETAADNKFNFMNYHQED